MSDIYIYTHMAPSIVPACIYSSAFHALDSINAIGPNELVWSPRVGHIYVARLFSSSNYSTAHCNWLDQHQRQSVSQSIEHLIKVRFWHPQ
jgi:hypothetical protein